MKFYVSQTELDVKPLVAVKTRSDGSPYVQVTSPNAYAELDQEFVEKLWNVLQEHFALTGEQTELV